MKSSRAAASLSLDGRTACDERARLRDTCWCKPRLNDGVSLPEFHARFGVGLFDAFPVLPDLYDGLLEVDCERLRLTPRGRLLHSEIAIELLEPAGV